MIDARTAPRFESVAPVRQLHAISRSAARKRRPKVFFATVTVVTIFIISVAQILLSISTQSGAYEIAGLQQQMKELGRTYQSVTQDLDRMTSPQNISHFAQALGMVGNSNPVYLRLSDSLVTGSASAATAGRNLVGDSNLVPNAMLTDVIAEREAAARAVSDAQAREAQARAAGSSAGNVPSDRAPAPASATGTVPSPQGIPSPTTH
jgi:cell division protein FtsL